MHETLKELIKVFRKDSQNINERRIIKFDDFILIDRHVIYLIIIFFCGQKICKNKCIFLCFQIKKTKRHVVWKVETMEMGLSV